MVVTLCDRCEARLREVVHPPTRVSITMPDEQKGFDLCTPCAKDTIKFIETNPGKQVRDHGRTD